MTKPIGEINVVVGSYTNQQGEQKNSYRKVGALWQGEKGFYITLDRTFNPAGAPFNENKPHSIMLSVFEPKEKDAAQPAQTQRPSKVAEQQAPAFDDDLPPF